MRASSELFLYIYTWQACKVVFGAVLALVILKILVLCFCATDLFKRIFANRLNAFTKSYNKALGKRKDSLFTQMRAHSENLSGDVLEIGCGTGANLEYLPGVSLIALDPNPHMEKHFRKNLEKYPEVNLNNYIVGTVEDMKGVKDNSVAAVFCTITMCSVPGHLMEKALQEIKRVLKPVSVPDVERVVGEGMMGWGGGASGKFFRLGGDEWLVGQCGRGGD